MHRILKKTSLSRDIIMYEVMAAEIAAKAQPGQFVIIRVDELGERIPLTINDFNRESGTITVIFQEVGFTTKRLACMSEGQSIMDIAGPLGVPTEISKFGDVVLVAGGIGTAPIYPIARAMKTAGNRITAIIGAKSAEYVILEEQMRAVSEKLVVCTDDGSAGEKGFVTDMLNRELNFGKPALVIAIGPLPMMREVCKLTKQAGIKTIVSLNPIMVDGTGMCGACRVRIGEDTKFACVEGPEFDGHQVDWDTLLRRSRLYKSEEKLALQAGTCGGGDCKCH